MEIRGIGGREMHDHTIVKRRGAFFFKKKDFICFPPYYNMIRFIYLCMYLAELGLSFGMRDL